MKTRKVVVDPRRPTDSKTGQVVTPKEYLEQRQSPDPSRDK